MILYYIVLYYPLAFGLPATVPRTGRPELEKGGEEEDEEEEEGDLK